MISFCVLLFACFLQCTLCAVGYDLATANMDNSYTLTCRDASGINIKTETMWFFNGSLHTKHPCTENAMMLSNASISLTVTPECQGYIQCRDPESVSVSLPFLLEAEPVLINSSDTAVRQLNIVEGDSAVIPCGIRVSSIGNFMITWFGLNIEIPNPAITQDYSLILAGGQALDAIYFCTAATKFRQGGNSDSVIGLRTSVNILQYEPPKITDIEMSLVDEEPAGVIFTLSVEGTDNNYIWMVNDEVLQDTDSNDIEINPTPPSLKLPRVNNGDSLLVRMMNTDVRDGATVTDSIRAFIFATTVTNTEMCSQTITVPTDVSPTNERATADSSDMFQIITYILAGIIVGLVVAIIAVFIIRYLMAKNNVKPVDSRANKVITVKIGENGNNVEFDVDKMNKNMGDFFDKINLIIGMVVDQTTDAGIRESIKINAHCLQKICNDWRLEELPKNRTTIDCSPTSPSDSSPPPYQEQVAISFVNKVEEIQLTQSSPSGAAPLEETSQVDLPVDQMPQIYDEPSAVRNSSSATTGSKSSKNFGKNSLNMLLPSLEPYCSEN